MLRVKRVSVDPYPDEEVARVGRGWIEFRRKALILAPASPPVDRFHAPVDPPVEFVPATPSTGSTVSDIPFGLDPPVLELTPVAAPVTPSNAVVWHFTPVQPPSGAGSLGMSPARGLGLTSPPSIRRVSSRAAPVLAVCPGAAEANYAICADWCDDCHCGDKCKNHGDCCSCSCDVCMDDCGEPFCDFCTSHRSSSESEGSAAY